MSLRSFNILALLYHYGGILGYLDVTSCYDMLPDVCLQRGQLIHHLLVHLPGNECALLVFDNVFCII